MGVRVGLTALVALSVSVSACTSSADTAPAPEVSTTTSATTNPSEDVPESPTVSPTSTQPTGAGAPAIGVGTAMVDGQQLEVSGDCDVSREFGQEPVPDLDEDVDLLLAVDNIRGGGEHSGPFPLRVIVEGGGPVTGRTVVSTGAITPDGGIMETRYEGTVEVAELRDRREEGILDVATLHLEASQQVETGKDAPRTRELVLDVACAVSRPG